MTPEEYLDPVRFPLTTQVSPSRLEARDQVRIDSFNLNVMRRGVSNGRLLTPEETARLQELELKAIHFAEVLKAIRE